MSLFVRLSTQALTDAKFLLAGPEASWMWIKGLLYSKEHLTDGFIPASAVPLLAIGVRNPKATVEMLLTHDLWRIVDGGYTVGADRWSRWQTTKDQVESQRDKARDRKQKSRERHAVTYTDVTHESQHQSTEHRAQSTEGEELAPTYEPDADEDDFPPPGLSVIQYRQHVCNRLKTANSRANQEAFQDAIEAIVAHEGLTSDIATARLIERARDHPPAKGNWRFWVNDGKWKEQSAGVSTEGWE